MVGFGIKGVAVVTGAGSGIGRDCALAFVAEGAAGVVFADLDLDAAQKTAEESNKLATNPAYCPLALAVDVTDSESVKDMAAQALCTFGRIDYSVNSAGVGVREPKHVADASPEEFDKFYKVNVLGTLHCIQAIGKIMRAQPPLTETGRNGSYEVGRGSIVNLGSCNSLAATKDIVQYTSSKHAVLGLSRNAALDFASTGVRVNTICPSWVDTPMVSAAIEGNAELGRMIENVLPIERMARPEEISNIIVFLCSPRASYVTGSSWVVDGGLTCKLA